MDGETRRPRWPRWALACALLLGLFLMHGAPVSAAGCHDAMAGMSPVAGAAVAGHMHTQAPGLGMSSHGKANAAASVLTGGGLCVSIEAPRGVGLPAVLLLAVLVGSWYLPKMVPWTIGRGGSRRGDPPDGGRGLLLRVCVART